MLLLKCVDDALNMALDVISANSAVAWRTINSNAVMKNWRLKSRSWLLLWKSWAHVESDLEQAAVKELRRVLGSGRVRLKDGNSPS